MKIFFHKLWVLFGNIIGFYILFGIIGGLTLIASFVVIYGVDWALSFVFDFHLIYAFDAWADRNELNRFNKVLIILPLFLFLFRHWLTIFIKEEDLDTKEFQIYNPFTLKGEIIYKRNHKKFVERNEKKY